MIKREKDKLYQEKTDGDALCRGRPRSADKNHAILHAAGDLFLTLGFDRTSMDQVARAAGVSKQTVYGHFESKEGLFRAVINHKVAAYFPDDPLDYARAHSLRETLTMVGRQYIRLIFSDEAVAMFRVLAANATEHPRMVRLFFEEGPGRLGAAITTILEQAASQGRLCCDDPGCAMRSFTALLRGDLHLQRVLGLISEVNDKLIDEQTSRAIEQFLILYPARS